MSGAAASGAEEAAGAHMGREAYSHMRDAGRHAGSALSNGATHANNVARNVVEKSIASIKEHGFWKSLAKGARRQPLIAGMAAIGGSCLAVHAVASPGLQEKYRPHPTWRDAGERYGGIGR